MQQVSSKLVFIDAETITSDSSQAILWEVDGICVPWGFGTRWIEWMIATAQYARENDIPYLWICLWSQIMAIEFARYVLWITEASSEETTPDGKHNVVHMMHNQRSISDKWGTMRLWAYPCVIDPTSHIWKSYIQYGRADQVTTDTAWVQVCERHRHRYEFNNQYREQFEAAWFHCCGTSPDNKLVEMVEITAHPCMIGTQAHPELKSRPTAVHPMIMGWVEKVIGE
jgi:CTP synthase